MIQDVHDVRYERGMALGDPGTAPLRVVTFHAAESGGSSFILRSVYNEFTEETDSHDLLSYDEHQMQYEYQYRDDEQDEETLKSDTLRISMFDLRGFDDSATAEEIEERVSQTMAYSNVVLLMYSVDNLSSFEGDYGIQTVKTLFDRQIRDLGQRKIVMLVGTKADLYVQRAVSREDGQGLADKYQIPFYEVSSRNGVGLREVIEEICCIHKKEVDGTNYPPPAKSSCCHIL